MNGSDEVDPKKSEDAIRLRGLVFRTAAYELSLDGASKDGDRSVNLKEVLSSDDAEDDFEKVDERISMFQTVGEGIIRLTPIQFRVLQLRGFLDGSGDSDALTLDGVASKLFEEGLTRGEGPISKERVRQIQGIALKGLARYFDSERDTDGGKS